MSEAQTVITATITVSAADKAAVETSFLTQSSTLDQFVTATLAQAFQGILGVVQGQEVARRARAFQQLSVAEQEQALIR